MLKGKSIIELTDVHTGKKEIYEDENLVTEAIFDILNTNIQGAMYNSPSFDSQSGEAWLLPIYQRLTGGILLYQDEIEEDPSVIYAPLNNPLIGYASNDANNTEDIQRGSRNLTESKVFGVDGGMSSVSIHPDGNMSWTAVASDTWIVIFQNASGTGDAEIEYILAPYEGDGSPRTGWIQIGDKKVYITQRSYDLDITPRADWVTGNAGAGEIGVSAGCRGCQILLRPGDLIDYAQLTLCDLTQ